MTATIGRIQHTLTQEEVATERRARRVWVGIVVGLLGLQIVTGVVSVMLAIGDPTVAIIPNYHQNAVNWDSTRRALQLTESLGLQVDASAAAAVGEDGKRLLVIELKDADGNVMSGVNLHAKVYHHADGKVIHNVQLKQVASGSYAGLTKLTQSGLWQLELRIEGEHGVAAVSREMYVD